MAYRCESPDYAASLVVERTSPRLTARTISFFRVDRDALNCHYELIFTVEEARDAAAPFSLPDVRRSRFRSWARRREAQGITPATPAGRLRRWNVLLAEPRRGRIRLAVDFQQPLPSAEPKGFSLPIAVADGVAYQSGLVGVEGCAELEVRSRHVRPAGRRGRAGRRRRMSPAGGCLGVVWLRRALRRR